MNIPTAVLNDNIVTFQVYPFCCIKYSNLVPGGCFQDIKKINEGKPPLYQDDTNKRILNSLDLLKSLDEDASQAVLMKHPQAEMIEKE